MLGEEAEGVDLGGKCEPRSGCSPRPPITPHHPGPCETWAPGTLIPPSHPGHGHHRGAPPENLCLLHEVADPACPLLHHRPGLRHKAENGDGRPR